MASPLVRVKHYRVRFCKNPFPTVLPLDPLPSLVVVCGFCPPVLNGRMTPVLMEINPDISHQYYHLLFSSEDVKEVLKREVTPLGNGAKVGCPKKHIGKTVYVIVCEE